MMKYARYLLLILCVGGLSPLVAQNDGMFNHKKERKRVWRHWNKKRDGYNPYLKKKKKDKPSMQESRSSKREQRRQKREFKKQLKHNKRAVSS